MAKDTLTATLGEFAAALSMTRDVLRRILAEAGVAPIGKRGGHPVYALRDVFHAVMAQHSPEELNPHARLALARALKAEDELRTRRGELFVRDDVREVFASAIKPVRQTIEVLPDILERDAGLTAAQVVACERALDALRETL